MPSDESLAEGFGGVQWIRPESRGEVDAGPEPGIVSGVPQNVLELPTVEETPEVEESAAEAERERHRVAEANEAVLLRLGDRLRTEIEEGVVVLERRGDMIVIRFPEQASFPLGSDRLMDAVVPVLEHVKKILADSKGIIVVAGHTDDLAIRTERFRSNWDLSSARAASVVHLLAGEGGIDPARLIAAGHADSRPLVPNDSPEHRAMNRRVEILLSGEREKILDVGAKPVS